MRKPHDQYFRSLPRFTQLNQSGKFLKVKFWSVYTTKSEPILNGIDRLPLLRRGRNSAKIGGRAKFLPLKPFPFLPARRLPASRASRR